MESNPPPVPPDSFASTQTPKLPTAGRKKIIVSGLFLIILSVLAIAWYYLSYKNKPQQVLEQPPKPLTIAILSLKSSKTYETLIASFKQSLAKKGYNPVYLQDDLIEPGSFVQAAKKYAGEGVDLIIANSTPAAKAALLATTTIPVVFGSIGDPVLNGIVENLDSSGTNATGVTSLSVELTATRLGLLKELKPQIKKVYFIYQPGETASENSRNITLAEARKLNITLVTKTATMSADVATISARIRSSEADAILMSASGMIWAGVDSLIAAQNREKIPLIGVDSTMAERGAVISFGPNYEAVGKQVAELTDLILKGTKPQYLPIQRPNKVEYIINQKTASEIGLTVDPALLSKADNILR